MSNCSSDMQLVASGLSFSILNIILFFSIFGLLSLFKKRREGSVNSIKSLKVIFSSVLLMLGISIVTGYTAAFVDSTDVVYKNISPTNRVLSGLDTFPRVLERNQDKDTSYRHCYVEKQGPILGVASLLFYGSGSVKQ